jgi:hypothetical protein
MSRATAIGGEFRDDYWHGKALRYRVAAKRKASQTIGEP